ncbi:sigma 54-interacting transcriptional regulator [Candidatus Babeliales bacterium]|nr:sigma 54-interacting transcriptional regulator [Candidatus Babeliales bacterium]
MNSFLENFQHLYTVLNSVALLNFLQIVSFVTLFKLLWDIFQKTDNSKKTITSLSVLILFIIPIIAILIENTDFIFKIFLPKTHPFCMYLTCFAWMTSCFKFHSFLLFLEKSTTRNKPIALYHYVLYIVEILFCGLLISETTYRFYHYNIPHPILQKIYPIIIVSWIISIIPSLIVIYKQLNNDKIPYILKKQLIAIFAFCLLPHMISIILEFTPYILFKIHPSILCINISLITITISIYYCFKRIMQFRFLNLSSHVQTTQIISNEVSLKNAIEQINIATTTQEIGYIVQQFFTEHIHVAQADIAIHIRSHQSEDNTQQKFIEHFLNSTNQDVLQALENLYKRKILIRHEIEFDAFYSDHSTIVTLTNFIKTIQSDIFIPIVNNKKIIAYITIAQQDPIKLYNEDQQNKMIVFAHFLTPAIKVLLQQNMYALLQDSKEIKESLYEKTQEINQYKESMKQLLKDRVEYHIGIIFYKNRHFSFKNQEAHTLLGFNPNLEMHNPSTATLTHFAQQIEKYQTTQSMHITVTNGHKLILTGMPNTETHAGVLLIIRKPEATDLIKMHIDALQDQNQRDYLLYLETTKAGQIVNKLLPNQHELFVQTKIKLLQSILQRSTLLIESNQYDIDATIDIINNVSQTSSLYILDAQTDEHVGVSLFGINPLFAQHSQPSILERYAHGTVVIKNIEHIDHVTQQKLVHLIKYGLFSPLKSEQRKTSNTRIIFTTSNKLESLHTDGTIIAELYEQIQRYHLRLPSMITMSDENLMLIIDHYMTQALQEHGTQKVQPLNLKEKEAIIAKRIPGLFELRAKIITFMILKAQEKLTVHEHNAQATKIIDPTCPELQLAAQLGKHALKDIQLMKNLWKKLGSQTKIAELLGVNRSSVSRRFKDFHVAQ